MKAPRRFIPPSLQFLKDQEKALQISRKFFNRSRAFYQQMVDAGLPSKIAIKIANSETLTVDEMVQYNQWKVKND